MTLRDLRPLAPALLAAATLAGCQLTPVPGSASTTSFEPIHLTRDGVTAELALESESAAAYCAAVKLENSGSAAVTGWTLVVDLGQATLSHLTGAEGTQHGTQLTVGPGSQAVAVAPAASASFGFCASTSAGPSRPGLASLTVVRAGGTSSGGGSSGGGSSGGASGGGDGEVRYTLSIRTAGTGTGSTSPAGATTHAAGSSVTVTATATGGSTFDGWSGDATGTSGSITVRMDADRTVTATFSAAAPRPTTFANPVRWEDLADIDVFRVDDTFYYTASNMHFSPGAPILRSYDLVNWEYAGHAIPVLDFSPRYDLNGGRAYIAGTWASFLGYRKSNKTFYWGGCIEFGKTYIYTATSVEGPWQKHPPIGNCYYDAGLLVDDDDTMYVAHGSTNLSVAQLTADGLGQVRDQVVYTGTEYLEGSRFYRRGGNYYILVTRPANAEFVLRSTTGPFGPYTKRPLLENLGSPIPGGGVPHQGGLVQTQKGDWYYLAFVDAYPGGRVPVLAPITWTADGWPTLQLVNGAWGASYPFPDVPPAPRAVKPATGVEAFDGTALGHEWEWNHNPDNTRWSLSGGLRLQTATVTDDLYAARNTLTHRILGPSSTATILLDYARMKDGDRAGLALLRDASAWIGVRRDGGATRVSMVSGLTMDRNWNTTSKGAEVASAPVSGGKIWLRLSADIRPGPGRQATFSYSTDGTTFTRLGNGFTMGNDWPFFMGHRFAMFNHATLALGGEVTVKSFELTAP